MDYYYDVLLNFQEKYCMFYEWDKDDTIEYVKKIPLIHVDSKTINNMISKIIEVPEEFLKKIENKTKLKQNEYLAYTCIFSDGKNNIALEFQENGKLINKSSLIMEDELNINEFIYNVSLSKIDYKIIEKDVVNRETRQELKIKKIIKLEIDNMFKRKEFSKLKYVYLEWFDELIDDVNKMYELMKKKLSLPLSEKELHIYELIKLSYNNV